MEVTCRYETSVHFQQTTPRYNLEARPLFSHAFVSVFIDTYVLRIASIGSEPVWPVCDKISEHRSVRNIKKLQSYLSNKLQRPIGL
jgi:hypothetical protein